MRGQFPHLKEGKSSYGLKEAQKRRGTGPG